MLALPGGGRALVHRAVTRRSRATTRPLGSVVLRRSADGTFRNPASSGQRPRVRLRLAQRGKRALAFRLDVANAVMPARLHTVCGQGNAQLKFQPQPFALDLRLRIVRPRRRAERISVQPTFTCRYDKTGAIRGLRVVEPASTPKLGHALAVRVERPAGLRTDQVGALKVVVRNGSRRAVRDVVVQAVLPTGLRVVGRTSRASVDGRHVSWRLAELRRNRARGFRLRVQPTAAGAGDRCTSVDVRAMARKVAIRTACISIRPAGTTGCAARNAACLGARAPSPSQRPVTLR